MAHGCRQFWGGAAERLTRALADPAFGAAARGAAGSARTLASDVAYRALCAARADLCDALDALCVPPPPWIGGGSEPTDLRESALALAGALAADRADPQAGHDAFGRGWLATGAADADDVATARRLLVAIERAFSSP